MLTRLKRRGIVASFFATAAIAALTVPAAAQAPSGQPLTIGFSMALTGPLSPNGKQALLGMKIWEEEINAKGGLLGRPVKLVYYDDQSQAAPVPGIYTKLIDVDKVDLVIGPYATVPAAAAMPVIMQKGKVFIILFGLGVNTEFNYPKFFAMIPSGPNTKPAFTEGFFEVAAAQNPKPQTVALHRRRPGVLQERLRGRRDNAKKIGLKIVYDRTYPPNTTDFSPIVRAIQAANPDIVVGLLLSARLGRHGADGQRGRLQAEDDRRRHGRAAGDRVQDASSARCSTASSTTRPGCRRNR